MRFGTWNYVREIKQTGEVYIKEMIVLKQGRDFYAFTDFNKYITGNNKKRSHKINEKLTKKYRTSDCLKIL